MNNCWLNYSAIPFGEFSAIAVREGQCELIGSDEPTRSALGKNSSATLSRGISRRDHARNHPSGFKRAHCRKTVGEAAFGRSHRINIRSIRAWRLARSRLQSPGNHYAKVAARRLEQQTRRRFVRPLPARHRRTGGTRRRGREARHNREIIPCDGISR